MRYRCLGNTGVSVSQLCLGALMFGEWGNRDHDDCVRIIHSAIDAGINFLDTADVYSAGESEVIVGKAIAGQRDHLVVATKVHGQMGEGPNTMGNSRRWIMQECENSLRRLGTDYIDLYQVHRPDPNVDIDETLGALTDLVRQGKVRYIGSSTFPPSQIMEAQWVSEKRGLQRFVCEQPPYSMLVRGVETEVLPLCQKYAMGVITWSPLGAGWLSGGWRKGNEHLAAREAAAAESRRPGARLPSRYDLSTPDNQAKLEAATALAELADEAGYTLIHMALAFVLAHPAVTSAIVGPETAAHLESQLGAADIELSTDVLDRIDAIVKPGSNFTSADAGYVSPGLADPRARRRYG